MGQQWDQGRNQKYLETNENKHTTPQNLRDMAKTILRGKCIALQAYLKKTEKSLVNNPSLLCYLLLKSRFYCMWPSLVSGSVGGSVIPYTTTFQIPCPVRAHAWVWDSIPGKATNGCFFLSLPTPPLSSLSQEVYPQVRIKKIKDFTACEVLMFLSQSTWISYFKS